MLRRLISSKGTTYLGFKGDEDDSCTYVKITWIPTLTRLVKMPSAEPYFHKMVDVEEKFISYNVDGSFLDVLRLAMFARMGGFKFLYYGSNSRYHQELSKALASLEEWETLWGEESIIWINVDYLGISDNIVHRYSPLSLEASSSRSGAYEDTAVMAIRLVDKLPVEAGALVLADSPIMHSSVPVVIDGRVFKATPLLDSITFVRLAYGSVEEFAKSRYGLAGVDTHRDPSVIVAAIAYGYNFSPIANFLYEKGVEAVKRYRPPEPGDDPASVESIVGELEAIIASGTRNVPERNTIRKTVEKLLLHRKAYGAREDGIMRAYIFAEASGLGIGFSRMDKVSLAKLAPGLARLLRERLGIAVSALDLEVFSYKLETGRASIEELSNLLEETLDLRSKASIVLATGIPLNEGFLHYTGTYVNVSKPIYYTIVKALERARYVNTDDIVRGMYLYALDLAQRLRGLPESDAGSIISAIIGDYNLLEDYWWMIPGKAPVPPSSLRKSKLVSFGLEAEVDKPRKFNLSRRKNYWLGEISGIPVVMSTKAKGTYDWFRTVESSIISGLIKDSPMKAVRILEGWRVTTINVLKRIAEIALNPRKRPSVDRDQVSRIEVALARRLVLSKEMYKIEPYLLAMIETAINEVFNPEYYHIDEEELRSGASVEEEGELL